LRFTPDLQRDILKTNQKKPKPSKTAFIKEMKEETRKEVAPV
jgi:hypothetical protein